jgi:dTDP-4-dehydrorhamnose 3,5-epimerase
VVAAFSWWVVAELGLGEALWIPPAFAYGIRALEETYFPCLVTKEYGPQLDKYIRWDDPTIVVKWPAPDKAILSQKDRDCPPLAETENNFKYS